MIMKFIMLFTYFLFIINFWYFIIYSYLFQKGSCQKKNKKLIPYDFIPLNI